MRLSTSTHLQLFDAKLQFIQSKFVYVRNVYQLFPDFL